jgi:hypothetical protein
VSAWTRSCRDRVPPHRSRPRAETSPPTADELDILRAAASTRRAAADDDGTPPRAGGRRGRGVCSTVVCTRRGSAYQRLHARGQPPRQGVRSPARVCRRNVYVPNRRLHVPERCSDRAAPARPPRCA